MPLSNEDERIIENYLNKIFDSIQSLMNDGDRLQVRIYIDAREYGLALDDMADIVLELKKPVTIELRNLFDAAAGLMDIKPGSEWSGVDDLLNSVRSVPDLNTGRSDRQKTTPD